MKRFAPIAALMLAMCAVPSAIPAQSVAGCGTVAIARRDLNDVARLTAAADCFAQAKARAAEAEAARRARIAALAPPEPTPTPSPTPTPAPEPEPTPSEPTPSEPPRIGAWVRCAGEGETCTPPYPTLVRYGADDRWSKTIHAHAAVACDNATFGDPLEGVVKACWHAVDETPPPVQPPVPPDAGDHGPVAGMPDGFNTGFYAAKNPDVVAAKVDPFWHYQYYGKDEGRAPHAGWSVAAQAQADAAGPVAGLPSIASNFDVADQLVPSWGHGKVAESGFPDAVGAFRFICNPSHNAYNDPIIYPGKKNASHLHTFFGNTEADENSTYESLRKTGESTCNNALNRSAYWIPAMMTPAGKVVMPDFISIYYKRRPADDPVCLRQAIKGCVALPRGLRYVFGYNMNTGAGWGYHFNCQGPGAVSAHFPNIPQAARGCPSGSQLGAMISAPDCWDGKNLDSPDHRSHMAYPSYGNWGYQKCPATHPYVIPTFTLGAWYTTDDTLDRSGDEAIDAKTWYLSSDRMAGMAWRTPGSTFHADWFGAWDDGVMKMWTEACIDKLLSCSGADLGNGKQLRMYDGFTWARGADRLVDPPKT